MYSVDDRTLKIRDAEIVTPDNYYLMVKIKAAESSPTSNVFDPSNDIMVLSIYFDSTEESTSGTASEVVDETEPEEEEV